MQFENKVDIKIESKEDINRPPNLNLQEFESTNQVENGYPYEGALIMQ